MRTSLFAVFSFLFALQALCYGRVGDSQSELEGRLLGGKAEASRMPQHVYDMEDNGPSLEPMTQYYTEDFGSIKRPDGGRTFRPSKLLNAFKDDSMPVHPKTEVWFYYKTSNGEALPFLLNPLDRWTPDAKIDKKFQKLLRSVESIKKFVGWELMVVYADSVSVLEAYRRIGISLSQYEVDDLLVKSGKGVQWVKTPPEARGPSFLGYDFESGDGKVRARWMKQQNILLIFNGEMDAALAKIRIAEKDKYESERKQNLSLSTSRF